MVEISVKAYVEALKQASESGELDTYMFSHPSVQAYIISEVSGSSFKLYRKVCLDYLKDNLKIKMTDKSSEKLFKSLPKGFVSVGAYILRKERNNASN